MHMPHAFVMSEDFDAKLVQSSCILNAVVGVFTVLSNDNATEEAFDAVLKSNLRTDDGWVCQLFACSDHDCAR